MTSQIALTLTILGLAVLLFVTEKLRVDLVALMVLGALALTGLITPDQALAGFSNPAVVTVWAIFILSGGLSRTGVANLLGRQVLRMAGQGEASLLVVIMLTAGVLSAFMNNVGVVALLLPVVLDIAQRTGRSPSRLLMPLAYGALLGGLTTLIGSPLNILVSDALLDTGQRPFQMFDYTPVGLVVLLGGVTFMALIGRHLLLERDLTRERLPRLDTADLDTFFQMGESLYCLRLPQGSPLAGKTLGESRLGSALGLNVMAIIHNGQTHLAPETDTVLRADDVLLVDGSLSLLYELRGHRHLVMVDESLKTDQLVSPSIGFAELGLKPDSSVVGQTLQLIDFRQRYGVIVLAIWRDGALVPTELDNLPLRPDDVLLVQGLRAQLEHLKSNPDFRIAAVEQDKLQRLEERLLAVRIPADSILVGKKLAESRIAEAFGLTVLGVVRQGETHLMVPVTETLQAEDLLLVKGREDNLEILTGLQDLEIDRQPPPDIRELVSDRVGLQEVVLSPHTTLAGKTLRQIHFREKYGLSVVAIWRGGKTYHTNLRDMALRFGDSLLLYGPREKIRMLGSDPDFLVLTEQAQEPPRLSKAPSALLVMVLVFTPVVLGWLPIAIAAVVGAVLMILSGCLSMEEAYRYIDWQVVFLIAGMLPLGVAMEQTGAARFLAESMINLVGEYGPLALIVGLYILTTLATQFLPNAAVAVLLMPIALSAASHMQVSSQALAMVVAVAAASTFLSPVGHPANLLVMGPGGYRFTDYLKVGLPLALLVMGLTMLVLPYFWPL